jgi:hypothetical protein
VSLNRIFFRDQDLIARGTKEYEDFWTFLQKYQAFQKKKAQSEPGKGIVNIGELQTLYNYLNYLMYILL